MCKNPEQLALKVLSKNSVFTRFTTNKSNNSYAIAFVLNNLSLHIVMYLLHGKLT